MKKTMLAVLFLLLMTAVAAHAQWPFTETQVADDFTSANSVYAGDIDGDGDIDIVATSADDDEVAWWENDGSENFSKEVIADDLSGPSDVFLIDVDSDGDLDVIVAWNGDDTIMWYDNDSGDGSSWTGNEVVNDFTAAKSVFAADLNGDGNIDILGTCTDDSEIAWWANDGAENFTKTVIADDLSEPDEVYAVDIDGDSDVDIAAVWYDDDTLIWYENDAGDASSWTGHSVSSSVDGASSVFAVDVDGDSDVDLLTTAYIDGEIAWWENNGSQSFTKHALYSSFTGATKVYATDLDDDGDVDVVGTAAGGTGELTWWKNDGSETFTKKEISDAYSGAADVYALDVETDGDVDLVAVAPDNDLVSFWEQYDSSVNIAGEVDGSILADNENVAAMFPDATDGYDSGLDIPDGSLVTPPSNYLEIYFPHAATGDWANPFSASRWMYDVRPNSDLTNAIKTFTFTVNTDQDGEDVILNFTVSNDYPSDYGVVLFDVNDDNYTDLKNDAAYEYDYTFDEGASSFNFYLQLGDATGPSVTYDNVPSDGQLYDTGATIPAEWTLTDVTDIRSTAAYYSLNGGTDWSLIGTAVSDPRIFTWDKSFTAPTTFTVQGKIRVLATDWAGNSTTDQASITFYIAPHTRSFTVPLGTSLVSVPEQLDNYFVETVFADLESAGRPYIVYKYTEGTGYTEVTEMEFGQGYAISLGDQATSVSLTGTPLTSSKILGLNTGWNIVGAALATTTNTHLSVSELEFSVNGGAWTKLTQAGVDGTISPFLYYNDGTGNTAASTLEPWKGYWLWVEETDSVRMRTNASDVSTPAGGMAAPGEQDNDEWFVPIVVNQGDLHDEVAGFGVQEGATEGFDLAYDMPAPPSMISYVRAVFNHPEWDARVGSRFARDMRAPFEALDVPSWTFTVEATDPGPVTVQFDVSEFEHQFPGASLMASYPGGTVDLTENDTFTVNYTEAFDVVVSVSNMNGVADGASSEIPSEFSIRSAHPNPFNPSVTVEFGVPVASRIRADVFNINGRHVATLGNSNYQAGIHSLNWNAAGLPSGIYFLNITSDHGWSASKKLLLMK